MNNEEQKKSLLERLMGSKKTKENSCCCNFELEEIADENCADANRNQDEGPGKTDGNPCCQ